MAPQQKKDNSSIIVRITRFWKRVSASENNRLAADSKGPQAVGTQAKAMESMEKNRKNFKYPKEEFITPIEHSLVYSMINTGIAVYPENVVLQHIDEEDFSVYLPLSPPSNQQNKWNETEVRVSYAQLSAITALSIEKFPSQKGEDKSISQKLCKNVLNCVTKYAEDHDLDRQAEIKEFLEPVEEYSIRKANQAEIPQLMGFYLGYTASLITANPIPMLVGFSVMVGKNGNVEKQRQNLNSVTEETTRRSDVEKTSLLDEQDF